MIKKLIFFLLIISIVPAFSKAQIIDVASKQTKPIAVVNKKQIKELENSKNTTKNIVSSKKITVEESSQPITDETLAEEETPPPPVNVTVEERIAIETESKKNISKAIRKKDTKEREINLGIMNWSEKELKIRKLMVAGMSYKDAKRIVEKTVKLPKMNIKKDKDVEKYIYKKGAFIADEQ